MCVVLVGGKVKGVSLASHISFVCLAGFTSGVKLWEVEFTKSGEFQKVRYESFPLVANLLLASTALQVSKAMDLNGHNASVLALSYSGDSHRYSVLCYTELVLT